MKCVNNPDALSAIFVDSNNSSQSIPVFSL